MISDNISKGDLEKLFSVCDSLIAEIDHLIFSPIVPPVEGYRIGELKHNILSSVLRICAIYGDLVKDFDSEVIK